MATVLCCIAEKHALTALMKEISRVLKTNGVLYLTDFLVCNHPQYREKYALGFQQFKTWGIYTTSEKLIVRHFTPRAILDLLSPFDIQWFEQFDFKTMNQNPARTFHTIAKKSRKGT